MRKHALLLSLMSVAVGCRDGGGGSSGGMVEPFEFDADAGASITLTPAAGGTVTSLDGQLMVIAPPGAVAQDTEITVHTLTLQDDPSIVVYELLPHGTTFDVPLSLHQLNPTPSIDGGSRPGTLFGVMSPDGDLEIPADTAVAPQTEHGSLDASLSHFSYVHTGHANVLEVEAEVVPADDGTVDAAAMPPRICEYSTFDVTTTVELVAPGAEGFPSIDLLEGLPSEVTMEQSFELQVFEAGIQETDLVTSGVVTIRGASGRPQDGYIRVDEQVVGRGGTPSVQLTQTFYCDGAGTGRIRIAHLGPGTGHLDGSVYSYSWEDTPAARRLSRELDELGDIDTDVDFNQAYGDVELTVECVPCDGSPITTCEDEPVRLDSAQEILDEAGGPDNLAENAECADPRPTQHGSQSDPGSHDHVQFHAGASWAAQFSGLHAPLPRQDALTTAQLAALDCGSIPDGMVVCADPSSSIDGVEAHVLVALMYGDVPLADPDNPYQYGFVFDADDDPTNNYVPPPQYPFDTFQDTDRWYQLWWDPADGWRLEVVDATRGQLMDISSRARVVILGNALVLLVPTDEMSSEAPLHRFTAYRGELVAEPVDFNIDAEPPITVGLRAFDGGNVPPPPRACIMNQTVAMGPSSDPIPGDTRRFASICPAEFVSGVGDCPTFRTGTCTGPAAEVELVRDGSVYTVQVQSGWTIVNASHGTEDPTLPTPNRSDLPEATDITLDLATPDGDTTVVFQLVGDTAFVASYDPAYPYD